MTKLCHITLLEMNQMIHPCTTCIFTCILYHFTIQVIPLNIHLNIFIYHIFRFLYGIVPKLFWNDICPFFCSKLSIHAWCNICCNHSCFNWKCSTTTERINKNSILSPWSQHNECCSQSLCNRSFTCRQTIPSLMKRISRSIKCNCYFIF